MMNSMALLQIILFTVGFCLSTADADRIQQPSLPMEEDRHRSTLSTEDARAAISKCPVCATGTEEKSLTKFTDFFTRTRNSFSQWLHGDTTEQEYNVDHEVLPIFVNTSMELTFIAERFRQQAIAVENNPDIPEGASWVFRASAANVQSLVSYFDTIMMEISASGATIDFDALECHLSRITHFLLQNTFPNVNIIVEETDPTPCVDDPEYTLYPTFSPTLSPTVAPRRRRSSNSQIFNPSEKDLICLASQDELDAALLLSPDPNSVWCLLARSIMFLIFLPLTVFQLSALLFSLMVLTVIALIRDPISTISLLILLIRIYVQGTIVSIIVSIKRLLGLNMEGAEELTLLLEVLQATPLSSSKSHSLVRQGSLSALMCEIEALQCQLDAFQENVIPPF